MCFKAAFLLPTMQKSPSNPHPSLNNINLTWTVFERKTIQKIIRTMHACRHNYGSLSSSCNAQEKQEHALWWTRNCAHRVLWYTRHPSGRFKSRTVNCTDVACSSLSWELFGRRQLQNITTEKSFVRNEKS